MFFLKCAQNIPRKICKIWPIFFVGWEGNGVVETGMGAEAESSFGGTEVHTIWAREAFKEKTMQGDEYRKIGVGLRRGLCKQGSLKPKFL